jgi:hypothetical protein
MLYERSKPVLPISREDPAELVDALHAAELLHVGCMCGEMFLPVRFGGKRMARHRRLQAVCDLWVIDL